MGTENGELSVQPPVLADACAALSAAADHLLNRLKSLDGNVSDMLSSWRGASGGAYCEAWRLWQRGADDVENGLALMAALLGEAGGAFTAQDRAAAATTGEVNRG